MAAYGGGTVKPLGGGCQAGFDPYVAAILQKQRRLARHTAILRLGDEQHDHSPQNRHRSWSKRIRIARVFARQHKAYTRCGNYTKGWA